MIRRSNKGQDRDIYFNETNVITSRLKLKLRRLSNYQHCTDVTDVIRTSSSYTILNTDYEEAQAA